jgi:transposase
VPPIARSPLSDSPQLHLRVADDENVLGIGACIDCLRGKQALDLARAEGDRLKAELRKAQEQLAEVVKLNELQKAELQRLKLMLHQRPEPNEPERVPRNVLQMVFEQLLTDAGKAVDREALEKALKEAANDDGASPETKPDENKRSRRGKTRPCLKGLPVVEVRETPPEVKACGGEGWQLVDEEVSERLAYQHAQFYTVRVVREKWVKLSPKGLWLPNQFVTAPYPDWMLPRLLADPSVIAPIIVNKCNFMLPWHRQEQMFDLQGHAIARSTMSDWTEAAYKLVAPIVAAMHQEGIDESYCIATDATGAPVRISGGQAHWHVFVFISDIGHITFKAGRRHSRETIRKMLKGFEGHLLSDASSIYNILYTLGVVAVACWAHARRYFWKARLTEPTLAHEALALIKAIFAIVRKAKSMPLEQRTAYRREYATPIVDALDAWVVEAKTKAEEGGRLQSALTYYTNQREALGRFLTDGRLEADNNGSERQARQIVKGRDNWQHFETPNGLEWYTTFLSLTSSCKLAGINPYEYLEQVLRLARHWPKGDMLALSPKYWKGTVAGLDPRQAQIIEPPWLPGVGRAARDGPKVGAA